MPPCGTGWPQNPDEGQQSRGRRRNGTLVSLNMLIELADGFDYTSAQLDRWARTAGFTRTEVRPLAGPPAPRSPTQSPVTHNPMACTRMMNPAITSFVEELAADPTTREEFCSSVPKLGERRGRTPPPKSCAWRTSPSRWCSTRHRRQPVIVATVCPTRHRSTDGTPGSTTFPDSGSPDAARLICHRVEKWPSRCTPRAVGSDWRRARPATER